jgi:hypothetical protein
MDLSKRRANSEPEPARSDREVSSAWGKDMAGNNVKETTILPQQADADKRQRLCNWLHRRENRAIFMQLVA